MIIEVGTVSSETKGLPGSNREPNGTGGTKPKS